MSYLSVDFFFFIAIVLFFYYILPNKYRKYILLLASIFFYLYYSEICFLILGFNILSTYLGGILIKKYSSKKKIIFSMVLIINIGIWFIIKEFNWGANFLNSIFTIVTIPTIKNLIVPLGISYYTLQSIGYLVDVYNGQEPEKNLVNYGLFISYFPAIVQGPISRYNEFKIEINKDKKFNYNQFISNLLLIIYGLIKKTIIADNIAILANYCFDNYLSLSGVILYVGAVCYAIQIYTDFSGCVDICRGVSGLFQINLKQNFDAPYFSKSIKEFWSRWHITLSSWLKDYIYIPLGGNRIGKVHKYINIIIVFLISGIWHGGSFIFWGLLHAAYEIGSELTETLREKFKNALGIEKNSTSDKIYRTIITFNLVVIAWIFFRANNLEIALIYIHNMIRRTNFTLLLDGTIYNMGLNHNMLFALFVNILLVILVDYLHYKNKNGIRDNILSLHIIIRWIIYFILIYDVILFARYGTKIPKSAFLYGGF